MEKQDIRLLVVILLVGAAAFSTWYRIVLAEETTCRSDDTGVDRARDRNLYVRGQMHYLSMDYGMRSCWNDTLKRFLHLACPTLSKETGTLEMELAVLLTSCFCQSQNQRAPLCPRREVDQGNRDYAQSLVQCAQETCFNHRGEDAFESIVSRMPDLCYYYTEELMEGNPEMTKIQLMNVNDLVEMKNRVSGESGEWTQLRSLEALARRQIQERKNGFKTKFDNFIKDLWYTLDHVKFRLGIGMYADPETYV